MNTSSGRKPNVLVVLFDDLGFGQFGCFGSDIATPNIDRLASQGLRYSRFHVTSVCSASRACLLTGRNHHSVGVGNLVRNSPPGAPSGYAGRISDGAGALPRILRGAGYNTAAFGKWHLTPGSEESAAGPFDTWPLGLGFERYYGFLRADNNQWTPNLVSDNHYVKPPRTPEEGYHFSEDLADNTIRYLVDQHNGAPDKPFFVYFALGAMHSPHHVPKEWADRYSGQFDDGWDRMRERIHRRQLELGVIPEETALTPRPTWIPTWDTLPTNERRLLARTHEVFAGYLTHADAQLGRIFSHLDKTGQLDNTIVLITSDNGASGEGGIAGTYNEHRAVHRLEESIDLNLPYLEEWGGFRTYPHYALGWAHAGNTPLRLWKRYTWLGGTRVPMVVHWPEGIRSRNETRGQIVHIIDILPTVLDVSGVKAPETIDGIVQQRIAGASFAATFDDSKAPSPRDTQYFEMMGSRAIIWKEWKATTNHVSGLHPEEAKLMEGSRSFPDDQWSLFQLDKDFSESKDVAAEYPEVLRHLQGLWDAEAKLNNVLPLMDNISVPFPWNVKTVQAAPMRIRYLPGGHPVPTSRLPRIREGGRISARVHVPAQGASGIVFALGDWNSGFALYAKEGKLTFALNRCGQVTLVAAPHPLAAGRQELGWTVTPLENGRVRLAVDSDGLELGSCIEPIGLPEEWNWQVSGQGMHIGHDTGFPVCDEYKPPFPWTGILEEIVVETRPSGLAADLPL